MVKYSVQKKDNTKSEPPDIFRAAQNDDPIELAAAIQRGQSLSDDRGDDSGLTPMHIACICRSESFLKTALTMKFDPWKRDANKRLAIDHARAQGLADVQRRLFDAMYPPGWDKDPVVEI